jgi:molybdate transport system substrate-binding protein
MTPKRLTFAIPLTFALPACLPAQVTVLTSGGFSAAYQELLPQFENSTGITVTTVRGASQGDGPTTIDAELRRGQPGDVVILSREGLAGLSAEGRIVLGSDVDLASVPLGVGVHAGTPHPDISTVNAFKQTLLQRTPSASKAPPESTRRPQYSRSLASLAPWWISSPMRHRPTSPAEKWRWSFCP